MNRKEKKIKIGEIEYTESELYQNEDDRNRILSLNELERETILSERVQKLIQEKERAALLKQKSESNNKIRKKDALEEIKLRRSQRKSREYQNTKRNMDDNASSFSSESESGEINDEDDLHGKDKAEDSSDEDYIESNSHTSGKKREKRKNFKRNRSDSSSYSLSISDDDEKKKKKKTFISLNDIERVRITRSFLEKYREIPIFDKKIEGCFVKLNLYSKSLSVGSGYLLAQIKSVVENKEKPPYMVNGRPCSKYLLVAHANQEKAIVFNIVSNSQLTEVEFRIWRDRMEKFKIPMPKFDQIKIYQENIEGVKNYKYSQDELNDLINRKREMKIKNQDKSINITYELSILNEEYNSAKQKFNETKDEKFAIRMNELIPKIENLTKMAKDREREDLEKAEYDRIANINKRNLQKQKLNDLENSLMNRKKRRENNMPNMYKRRDCNPINLFDSGYLNKPVIKSEQTEEKLEEAGDNIYDNEDVSNKEINQLKMARISEITKFVKRFSDQLEEVIKMKKEKMKEKKIYEDADEKKFFTLLGVNWDQLSDLIKIHNEKFNNENYKVVNLDQLEY